MATERLSMRNIREVLRQKWVLKKSHREAAQSIGTSAGAVGGGMLRAQELGLDWEQTRALSDEALEQRIYGAKPGTEALRPPLPDPAYIHLERSRPGVTLELLHCPHRSLGPPQSPESTGTTPSPRERPAGA